MSAAPLRLVLPAGPLAWLHPELRRAEAPGGSAHLDLTREPLNGDALLAALAARGARQLIVPAGPRAWALQAWLAARGAGVAVHSEEDGLELRVATAARRLAAETLLVSPLTVEPRPLDARSAREALGRRDAAWLLPLAPGADARDAPAREAEAALLQRLDEDPSLAALAREAGLVPVCLTSSAAPSTSRATTRLAPTWWGLLRGDAEPAEDGALRAFTRRLCPDRLLRLLALRQLALAGADAWSETLAGRALAEGPALAPPPRRARVFAIEGIDGAGKSAHAAALAGWLSGRGLDARTRRIFRRGVFHETVTELTRRCLGDRCLHLWRLQRLVKAADSLKVLAGALSEDLRTADVVIFDRYVPTHLVDGPARLHHDPFTRELLAAFPRPELAWLLDLPEDEALSRIGQRGARTVDEHPWMLWRWRERLLRWARDDGRSVLDARAPFDENQRVLREEVQAALDGVPLAPRPATASLLEVSIRAPGGAARLQPARLAAAPHEVPAGSALIVDPSAHPDTPPLLDPRGEFRAIVPWLGELLAAGRIPVEVAVHLYACEILERLHERTRAGERGPWSVPLSPRALARAAGLQAHALREVRDAWPWPLRVEARPAAAGEIDRAAREWLGWTTLDAAAYAAALTVTPSKILTPPRGAAPAHEVADALLLRDGRVLLEARPEDARVAPGAWDSPGGHIEPGETPPEALRRELREELGVDVTSIEPQGVTDEVESATGEVYRHHVFVVSAWSGEVLAREGQTLAWWPLADARALPALQPVTAAMLAQLGA